MEEKKTEISTSRTDTINLFSNIRRMLRKHSFTTIVILTVTLYFVIVYSWVLEMQEIIKDGLVALDLVK